MAAAGRPEGQAMSKSRPAGTLKNAVHELVDGFGGQIRAAAFLEVSKTTVQKWTDPDGENADIHISAHRVWQLESAARNPVVTQWLAAEAGCALLHLPPGGLPDAWADDLAVVMREVADVVRQVAGDLADGRIDRPGEAIREIDEAMGALAALRVRMKTELDRKESGA